MCLRRDYFLDVGLYGVLYLLNERLSQIGLHVTRSENKKKSYKNNVQYGLTQFRELHTFIHFTPKDS